MGGGCGLWACACKSSDWCGLSHRVPGNHATSEVIVRALHASVYDVHAHAHARQVAVVVFAVDRAACLRRASTWVRGRGSAEERHPGCRGALWAEMWASH